MRIDASPVFGADDFGAFVEWVYARKLAWVHDMMQRMEQVVAGTLPACQAALPIKQRLSPDEARWELMNLQMQECIIQQRSDYDHDLMQACFRYYREKQHAH